MKSCRTSAMFSKFVLVLPLCFILFALNLTANAADEKVVGMLVVDGTDTSSSSDTPLPDLFTGTMSYRIPIEVPSGRRGVDPGVVLTYRSTNGNGWLGVGWELEMGAIERNTKGGVKCGGNEFVLRGPGGVSELVQISADGVSPKEYRAKIEGSFTRYLNYGTAWEAVSKKGVRFRFGDSATVHDPNVPSMIFKWALNTITDKNGNYLTLTYQTDSGSPGQIYLDHIDYTGNGTTILTTNTVKFNLEDRTDATTLYTINFAVKTGKRLKSIEVSGGGALVRKYVLNYDAHGSVSDSSYSPVTGRSVLASVTESGSDGTAKPPVILHYSNGYPASGGLTRGTWSKGSASGISLPNPPAGMYCIPGRFGFRNDLLCSTGANGGWDLAYLFFDLTPFGGTVQWPNGRPSNLNQDNLGKQCVSGDFKGNGTNALACNIDNNSNWTMAFPDGLTGKVWTKETWQNAPSVLPITQCFGGDFDGNGKTDFACYANGKWNMALSTGSGFSVTPSNTPVQWTDGPTKFTSPTSNCLTGDFNGDGKTDFVCKSGLNGYWDIYLANGNGWTNPPQWISNEISPPVGIDSAHPLNSYCLTGDFNGDGKTDLACYNTSAGKWYVALSTGSGWDSASFTAGGPPASIPVHGKCLTGDFNGDGRTDISCYTSSGSWSTALSLGTGWNTLTWSSGATPATSVNQQCFTGDFAGIGKTNILCYPFTSSTFPEAYNWELALPDLPPADLLTNIANGFGGITSISYAPSFGQPQLPFTMQLVSSVAVSDGTGNTATSYYQFYGGYYHSSKKDFRGFNQAKVTGPSGADGKSIITETWFHQGDDTAAGLNDASATEGFMKGKPYLTRVSDTNRNIYSETETAYRERPASNPPAYYFNPPLQVDTYICDGSTTVSCKDSSNARRTKTTYEHDDYGNVTREDRYGDVSNSANSQLNMTIKRDFQPNTTSWLTGFPATESIFKGIGTADVNKISQTDYYYDNYADCGSSTAPSSNQSPDKGNVTRVVRWLKDGTSPETRTAYYDEGNPKCSRDPNGNVTTIAYDASNTFPVSSTNAKSQTTTFSYYGVNGVAADKGRYGQLKSVTDANNATTSYEYDQFGRKVKETQPDKLSTKTDYSPLGIVGSQNIYTSNSLGLWSAAYFDGLGRTFKTKRSGPDKDIITETAYDGRGQVSSVSTPYFDGTTVIDYRTYTYDALGRVRQINNPDATSTATCYNDLITGRIDENGHKRRETRDPLGRLVTVEEYSGTYTTCDTAQGTPYTTTTYGYDVLGNLTTVTVDASKPGDPANIQTTAINYDTLGRKKNITDPDMGFWQYTYYPNGSLYTVTDANNKTITYEINDPLNRPTAKRYPTGSGATDVTYTYDETTSTNAKGRLTKMSDGSGSTIYNYDTIGRPTVTTKSVKNADATSTNYTISKTYDGLGRLTSLKYPDSETIGYHYDKGGNLLDVTGYAEFDEYNALGQPGKLYHGNGIITSYLYHPKNKRLLVMKAYNLQTPILYKNYSYDNKGNIIAINDLANPATPQSAVSGAIGYSYWPNKANRLQGISSRPLAVFRYDDNGNLTSDGTRTISYTPDNMPKDITMGSAVTSFTYDGSGQRVKKYGLHNRTYIGNLHGCADSVCGNYIYAGSRRIAYSQGSLNYYYHGDHLGSTGIVTNENGDKIERIAYYPFGEARDDTGIAGNTNPDVIHKFTGQERDYETKLYNYDARLYDPEIGRFISPDSIVPNPGDPQSLNRYAYALGNPMRYSDPTGHSDYDEIDSIDYGPAPGYTSPPDIYVPGGGGGGGGSYTPVLPDSPTAYPVTYPSSTPEISSNPGFFSMDTFGTGLYNFFNGPNAGVNAAMGILPFFIPSLRAEQAVVEGAGAITNGLRTSTTVSSDRAIEYLMKRGVSPEVAEGYMSSFEGPITARLVRSGEEFLRYTGEAGSVGNFLTKSQFSSPSQAIEALYLSPYPNKATFVQPVISTGRSIAFEGGISNGATGVKQYLINNLDKFYFGMGARY